VDPEEPGEGPLSVLRFGQDQIMHVLVRAVETGGSILIESIGETFDPIIDPQEHFHRGDHLYDCQME
jgi:hypothetical protein